jgi:hypothetical protein
MSTMAADHPDTKPTVRAPAMPPVGEAKRLANKLRRIAALVESGDMDLETARTLLLVA